MTLRGRHYQVLIEPLARRAFRKLPGKTQAFLIARIESLGFNPRPPGMVKLAGHEAYRVRVGDHRIIYSVLDDRQVVLVVDVGNRRDVYRGW